MLSKILNMVMSFLPKHERFIGKDKNGNSYFESNKGKRRIVYHDGHPKPTAVPPEWHVWLHYTDDKIPSTTNDDKKSKAGQNLNLIGNKTYYKNQKVKNYYQSWNPNTKNAKVKCT